MRLKQILLGIVGLLAIGGTSACGPVSQAKAANNATQIEAVSVEVSPNRASPGSRIAVRASCSDKSTSATVASPAFGTTTVVQSTSSTLLVADVVVPNTVQPGTFTVTVTCRGGATATTKLTVVINATAQPTVGPHTGGGFLGGREDGMSPAVPWLAGSAATLVLAATLGVVSIRRRHRRTRAIAGELLDSISADRAATDRAATHRAATDRHAEGIAIEQPAVDR